MSLLFAAIGAIATALVEASLGPYLAVEHVQPHPVLVVGVIWTIAAGLEGGITFAFVGGLVLDSLFGRPLGVSAFALLIAAGAAAAMAQPFPRLRVIVPIVAVPILSLMYSLLVFALRAAAEPGVSVPDPIGLFLPPAAYDGVVGILIGPLAISIHDRRAIPERAEW
jgi:rod shape-determining protein MreD